VTVELATALTLDALAHLRAATESTADVCASLALWESASPGATTATRQWVDSRPDYYVREGEGLYVIHRATCQQIAAVYP
jgi:hypothetical protein